MLLVAALILIMFKLAGVIYWDWWIVLIPLYPFLGAFIAGTVVIITSTVYAFFDKKG